MAVVGTWHLLAGTGTLSTLMAGSGGSFKPQMTSAETSEMTWAGNYDLG
jgi:hypothetical protein